jgi:hypothetical protein
MLLRLARHMAIPGISPNELYRDQQGRIAAENQWGDWISNRARGSFRILTRARVHTPPLRSAIADSSWINAVSFSSARATKRVPLSRCASTIHIVRPSQSTAETQPKLQPRSLRLSAIISQYFIASLPFSSPDEFPTPRNLSVSVSGLNDPLARVQCHRMPCQ